ncbi:hypothetical protein V1502_14600 [Bacillus sp. SCS-153A]|uniref:hypothetical protein n=1 Tax=Rossellomorea sedimentorum TaxID=3115294 RepID=UPI003906CA9B
MNKQSTRALATGIFLSAIILLLFSYFEDEKSDPLKRLEDQGYVVLDQEEAKKQKDEISDLQKQIETLTQSKSTKEDKEDEAADDVTRKEITLTVTPGMTPIEIADELESSGIIKNASDLNSYLINSGLADKVQIGEYKLHSEMTLVEITKLITN